VTPPWRVGDRAQVRARRTDFCSVTPSQSASDPTARPTPGGSGRRSYLRAAEAAALLHVSPKTISRWAREGKLGHVVTLGGHRRFSRSDIEALADRMAMTEDA